MQNERHARTDHSVACLRERPDISRRVDLTGPGLARERGQLARGIAVAHDQTAAALAQRCGQLAQRGEQERGTRRTGVTPAQQPVVEAEDRYDAIVLERRPERRMVGEPQVAPEPQQRGQPALTS